MIKKYSLFAILVFVFAVSVFAQSEEGLEAATSSTLTRASLPKNAMRMLPESIPANVNETLQKLAAAGEGKLRQGETEVLVWAGAAYQQAGKATPINRMLDTLKVAGWKYEVGGEESGVTIFSLLKDGAQRRALIGFYGESDGILVVAMTELLPVSGSDASQAVEDNEPVSRNASGDGLVGKWDNGSVSMVNRQNTVTGSISPGRSTRFEYSFMADGRFAFTGLAQTTNFSCTDTLYNEKAGKYSVNGSTLTLTPSKNYWKKTNSCNASGNSERNYTLNKEVYEVSFKTDDFGKQLICLNDGKNEACYRRKE